MAVSQETIVVLRALGLGDLLTGIPALRGLRRAHPDAHIVLAAPERYRDLVMLSGAVDELDPTPGLGRLRGRSEPPALAVNLHGSGPESIADPARGAAPKPDQPPASRVSRGRGSAVAGRTARGRPLVRATRMGRDHL
ncbi:hypothetical protein M4D79_20485 [Mycolicibacterium novocastrense]|nr:hypothetical protein M4D79_20485 [Mycolicibacterium novocastrense]